MIKRFITRYELKRDLERTVRDLKENYHVDADIKISLYNLPDKIKVSVDGNKLGWSASIIKVPIMVSVLEEIEKSKFSLDTLLKVDHRFTLELNDTVSMLPDGLYIPIKDLLYYMIVESDNEATNILANEIGIDTINNSAWNLGLKRTMLGHLLCPRVPRYSNKFNPDGGNVTCPNDMVAIMRHIYDDSFSQLSPKVRALSDQFLSYTRPLFLDQGKFEKRSIKAKVGLISDPEDGSDIHEVGIIDDSLIVCVMLNKFDQNKKNILKNTPRSFLEKLYEQEKNLNDLNIDDKLKNMLSPPPLFVYSEIMGTLAKYVI